MKVAVRFSPRCKQLTLEFILVRNCSAKLMTNRHEGPGKGPIGAYLRVNSRTNLTTCGSHNLN